MARSGTVPAAVPGDRRSHILDVALALMSEQGSTGASMRQLAAACGLNVATIYHYFPSKADLLRSVIEERHYGERLGADGPDLDPSAPPRERLVALVGWLWANARDEEAVWRLLVGEALRGEATATASAAEVVGALAASLEVWIAAGFPERADDAATLARVVQSQVFALMVEHLALGAVSDAAARARAEDLARLLFP